jgi:hypothetical protein
VLDDAVAERLHDLRAHPLGQVAGKH